MSCTQTPLRELKKSKPNPTKSIYFNSLHITLEYVFFHKTTRHLFEKAATTAGNSVEISCVEARYTVKLPENSD
jgi:hypothetical protein